MDLDYYEFQSSIIQEDEVSYQDEGIMDQLKEELENERVLKAIGQVFINQNNENEERRYLNKEKSISKSFPNFDMVIEPFLKESVIEVNNPSCSFDSFVNEVSKISSQSDNHTLICTPSFTEKKRKSRKKNDNQYLRKDNIREKIKRRFFNVYLINKLEVLRKKIKFKNYFCKFPSFFAKDVKIDRNKKILNITLREIFEKEELYNYENENGLKNYKHNLIIVQTKEIKEDEEFKKILNKTFYELYKEYLDDFKIEENKNLKNKRENDNYIETYNNLMDNLMEFFK